MSQLIDIIHLLTCHLPHESDMLNLHKRQSGKLCYYYLECDISDGHNLPDHLLWKSITEKLKTSLSLSSDKEAMDFIRDSIKLSQELKRLVGTNEARLHFIHGLLG